MRGDMDQHINTRSIALTSLSNMANTLQTCTESQNSKTQLKRRSQFVQQTCWFLWQIKRSTKGIEI